MDVLNTEQVLQTLHARLLPVESAETLIDAIEGRRPMARMAAVLLPLFEVQGQLHLALIRRSTTLRSHSGEIAFPGGKRDPADLSLVMTALREAQEEIGLSPARARILGLLDPVFTVVSNYLITPVVAFLPHGPGNLQLQESEVAELIDAPLAALANPAIAHTEQWTHNDSTRTIYFYDYGDYRIWGATGRILATFLAMLQVQ